MTDENDRELMRAVARYLERVNALQQREQRPVQTPLGAVVSEHLGAAALDVGAKLTEVVAARARHNNSGRGAPWWAQCPEFSVPFAGRASARPELLR